MLGRLFLRTLPNHFTENSTYTWFPLMTPEAMQVNLTSLNLINKYDLNRPTSKAPYITVKGHAEIAQILGDPETFRTPYLARASTVIPGAG
jgi:linoleate 10R-lipoxygenase